MKSKCTWVVLATIFPAAMMMACSPSPPVPPGLQIMLVDDSRLFRADWRGEDLKPQLLADFPVTLSPADPSVVGNVIAIAGWRTDPLKSVFYFVDATTGTYQLAFERDGGVYSVALAPGKQAVAFSSKDPASGGRQIFVYEFASRQERQVVAGRAFHGLSWTPDASGLTYDTLDSWIETVSLKTGQTKRLFKGYRPAWSPDGTRLAYQLDNTFYLYDPARQTAAPVGRLPWLLGSFRSLNWSPDGRYVSVNAEGSLGPGLFWYRCLVVDVAAKRVFNVAVKTERRLLTCGPWLPRK
jgi:dipeptidyl aminopeptidase/acylaminoacyl peptidase